MASGSGYLSQSSFKHLITVPIVGAAHAVLEAPIKLFIAVKMAKSSVIVDELARSRMCGRI
jgi:hypothetical protein